MKVLATLERAANGWVVTSKDSSFCSHPVLCVTWEEVLSELKRVAFWNENEPVSHR